jgi:Kef-type K+ transport system membrane component KefB
MEGVLTSAAFQMSLLLLASLAGYLLASRIHQSAVICEILVGLVIGPSVLGWITYTDFVHSIAYLGAIILLFVVGLEFKFREIYRWKYGVIALVGVIVPFLGGFFLAELFDYPFASSLFVGTALTATSIAITAAVLKEMNKLDTPSAKAIIGAAVIDDVLALLVLSFSAELVHGTISSPTILLMVVKAVGFLVVGSLIGYLILNRLVIRIDNTQLAKRYPEFVFAFAMMIAFFYSVTAELIGLSAIVGAFIAGVSLSGVVPTHSWSFKEGAEYFRIIFASIFFVSLGVIADLRALDTGIVVFMALLFLVALATKFIGCFIPARLLGMSTKDSLAVGVGMAPRGEVAMIIALIGLTQGLIGQDIYVALVLVALLTTIITPALLKWTVVNRADKGSKFNIAN